MFVAEPEFTMTDHLESYLAKWTGKDSWRFVDAKLELRLSVPLGDESVSGQYATRYEVYTYEVEEAFHTASIRTASGYQERAQVGDSVMIQYNPVNPAISYYAPACVLANRFTVGLVLLGGVTAIALAVRGVLEQR